MREIKFRAWHITSGMATFTMNDLYNFEAEGARKSYVCFPDGDIHKLDDVEVMQFTGLYDKNGKEIYEGDIIVTEAYPFFDNQQPNYRGVVEWIYSQWQVVLHCVNVAKAGISEGINQGLNDIGLDEGERFNDVLVIGNIYENPELLEGK